MQFEDFSFGSVRIDGTAYKHDVVIDRGEVRRRKKKASKKFRDAFGHTPLSLADKIPWKCRRLVIGTGTYGRLPVMKEVLQEAERHPSCDVLIMAAQTGRGYCTNLGQLTLASVGVESPQIARSFGGGYASV